MWPSHTTYWVEIKVLCVLVTWMGDGAYCGWRGSCMESLATDFSGLGGEERGEGRGGG
jgi:hypothetical protein